MNEYNVVKQASYAILVSGERHKRSIAHAKGLLEFSSFLLHFCVEIPANRLLCPRLIIILASTLLFGTAHHICHSLKQTKKFKRLRMTK